MTPPAIELADIEVRRAGKAVLRGVDLCAGSGEWHVIMGPSAGGKTTLLRAVAGLQGIDQGRIALHGRPVSAPGRAPTAPWQRGVAMLFQDLALWPHMSCLEHVSFVLPRVAPEPPSVRRQRACEVLERFGIVALAERMPTALSGGQRQRLALARAVASGARILLLDEPSNNLDPMLRQSLLVQLGELRDRRELTALYVTHQLEDALALGDRIHLLLGGRLTATLTGDHCRDWTVARLCAWYERQATARTGGAPQD